MSERHHTPERPARILVVDDQRVHRHKLVQAVRALGHEAEAVDSGAQALLRLQETRFDLVLLDIVMPDMSGFEVLDVMRRDHRIGDTPVIVVSALQGEMESVVRAVELGAEDMLPKHFDAVLLEARLDSVLQRRRVQLQERENRLHMNRLVDAASILEKSPVPPSHLGLAPTCARDDAIGRLARVFVQMIDEAQSRDARLQRQLDGLRSVALALLAGLLLGFALPLAHMALAGLEGTAIDSVTLALWLAVLIAMPGLGVMIWRGNPVATVRRLARPATGLALTGGLLGVLPVLWLLQELPVVTLTTVLPAELAIALLLRSALLRRRLALTDHVALLFGCAAIALLFLWPGAAVLGWRPATVALALCAPLGWALAAYALRYQTVTTVGLEDTLPLIGLAATIAAAACVPLAVLVGSRPLSGVSAVPSLAILAAVLLAICIGVAVVLRVLLIRQAGTIASAAASLVGAVIAVGIAQLTLGEALPAQALVPLALYSAGLFIRGLANDARRNAIVRTLDVEPA